MKNCEKCGQQLAESAQFCQSCGNRLTTTPREMVVPNPTEDRRTERSVGSRVKDFILKNKVASIAIVFVTMVATILIASEVFSEFPSIDESPAEYFDYDIRGSKVTIVEYEGKALEVRVPERIDGCTVTEIGSEAFRGTDVTYVYLPDTINYIGDDAFHNCEDLTMIRMPEKLTKIRRGTFTNCESLEKISIPENLEVIEGYVFEDCMALKKVELPDTLIKIESGAFYGSGIVGIELPDGLEYIGNGAFAHCKNLSQLEIPNKTDVFNEYTQMIVPQGNGREVTIHYFESIVGKTVINEYPGQPKEEVKQFSTVLVLSKDAKSYGKLKNWEEYGLVVKTN